MLVKITNTTRSIHNFNGRKVFPGRSIVVDVDSMGKIPAIFKSEPAKVPIKARRVVSSSVVTPVEEIPLAPPPVKKKKEREDYIVSPVE